MRWRPTKKKERKKKKITTRTRQDEERREVPREPDCVRETYMSDVLTTGNQKGQSEGRAGGTRKAKGARAASPSDVLFSIRIRKNAPQRAFFCPLTGGGSPRLGRRAEQRGRRLEILRESASRSWKSGVLELLLFAFLARLAVTCRLIKLNVDECRGSLVRGKPLVTLARNLSSPSCGDFT